MIQTPASGGVEISLLEAGGLPVYTDLVRILGGP
jgi:hypothetical protein